MGKYDADTVKRNASHADPSRKAPTPQQLASRNKALRTQRIAIIAGCSVALLVLIIVLISILGNAGKADDHKILPNVYAAGINLGGMSQDDAKSAVRLAVNKSLVKNPMVAILPDGVLELDPADTGVSVDVDAVVEAAYRYGRTGTKEEQRDTRKHLEKSSYTIALLPYMKGIKLEYIYSQVEEFCATHGSQVPSTVTISGERPTYDPNYPSSSVKHQVLTITIGAPDYKLSTDDLYAQILDAYSLNNVEIIYESETGVQPESLDAEQLFKEYCTLPQDATKDPETYEITPEVYGYGFDIDDVQYQIDMCGFGETIEVELKFLYPNVTTKDLKDGVFEDNLGECTTTGTDSDDRNNNLQLSCQALNGVIIAPGQTFSFNQTLGRPTAQKGYKQYSGISGGGIEQTASALYYCALLADLEIVERTNNRRTVDYIEKGLDVRIEWEKYDFRFTNTTDAPIRIEATAKDSTVTVRLVGTDNRNYTVNIITEVLEQYEPEITYQSMDKNNVYGYTNGTVLEEGIMGYKIRTSIEKVHKQTELVIDTKTIDTSTYSKRDQKVVSIRNSEE